MVFLEGKKVRLGIWILLIIGIAVILGMYITSQRTLSSAYERMYNDYAYVVQLEQLTGVGKLNSTHIHADFKVFVLGEEIDLNKEELQAPESGSVEFWAESGVSKFVHLHAGEEYYQDVIHIHATEVTLGMFFRTMKGELNRSAVFR